MSGFEREAIEPGVVRTRWWHSLEDGRVQCDLCPRECKLHEGQRGFCFVRQARDCGVVLTSYGRASGFCVDPIEKKPLNHFYPGTSVLSFGTAGCNLGPDVPLHFIGTSLDVITWMRVVAANSAMLQIAGHFAPGPGKWGRRRVQEPVGFAKS